MLPPEPSWERKERHVWRYTVTIESYLNPARWERARGLETKPGLDKDSRPPGSQTPTLAVFGKASLGEVGEEGVKQWPYVELAAAAGGSIGEYFIRTRSKFSPNENIHESLMVLGCHMCMFIHIAVMLSGRVMDTGNYFPLIPLSLHASKALDCGEHREQIKLIWSKLIKTSNNVCCVWNTVVEACLRQVLRVWWLGGWSEEALLRFCHGVSPSCDEG